MTNILQSYHNWIQWVHIIDSNVPWPTIGIVACTHGGETVWIHVIQKLEKSIRGKRHLIKGKIVFILANIEAYKKNIKLQKHSCLTRKDIINSRYIEENLNRCCDTLLLQHPHTYERKRANELTSVLNELDIVVDIHSTTQPSWSMTLHTKKSYEQFKNIFNTDEVYLNLIDTIKGKPLLTITENAGGIGIGIETWCQLDTSWYTTWLDNIYRILLSFNMISKDMIDEKNILLPKKANQQYMIIGSIMKNNTTFKPIKPFKNLEKVKKWSPIAHENDKMIYAEQDCLIIMPGMNKPWEEYCFLAKPLSSIN